MFQRAVVAFHWATRRAMRTRHIVAALAIGLALTVSACGVSQPAATPTATPKPTATATPVPCTTWRIIPSPNSAKYPENGLSAVAALSPTNAWAVGSSYNDGGPIESLIVQWDGTAWHVVSSPGKDGLRGVAIVSANDIWAVGSLSSHQERPTTMIEHWNGTQWSIVSSPNPGLRSDTLNSVVAVSANEVWAVGETDTSTMPQPLTERWDGAAWHVVSSPVPPGATWSYFKAITRIPGTNQLWAVGSVRFGTPPAGMLGYFQPLIERWDGASWQIVTPPALPAGSIAGNLNSVIALSATDAWAVGEYNVPNQPQRALIAHWDGSTWKLVAGPDLGASLQVASLGNVAAAGPNDIRAVGHTYTTDGARHTLLVQWNGSTWQTVTSPEPSGAVDSSLGSITADSSGNFWIVGSYRDAQTIVKTLTLHCP